MPEEQIAHMTVAGWVFLALSWTVITTLVTLCICKVLRLGKKHQPDETTSE